MIEEGAIVTVFLMSLDNAMLVIVSSRIFMGDALVCSEFILVSVWIGCEFFVAFAYKSVPETVAVGVPMFTGRF